ncbi:TetR/AcrR family transcriptional regulator C-terminal domain-containing protein [Kitasatospora sp. NBC_01266]|uniref:TetR/AcrR family transcriptional regulator C-terminal domain-containing protein n=1 Tax=Kitasatospora sp. NBC_01266 TaxID=2903572 RepID=UPI002E33DAF2|nr:TetR/AcrR family transcriptional regulator C-terminal domain-containing protein [Kitasatospora sp. NBC_01266]
MPIDRDHAVRVALRMLDEDGLEKLSLRRIAAELDVKAPALYWHFANKRALLDHMTDLMLAPLLPRLAGPDPVDAWPQWLERMALLVRETLLAHRDGAQVALGAGLGRATALGTVIERSVEVLHAAGFELGEASRIAGAFNAFLLGRAAEEQSMPAPGQVDLAAFAAAYPMLATGMAKRAADGDTPETAFRYAVGIMLAGIRALHAERLGG